MAGDYENWKQLGNDLVEFDLKNPDLKFLSDDHDDHICISSDGKVVAYVFENDTFTPSLYVVSVTSYKEEQNWTAFGQTLNFTKIVYSIDISGNGTRMVIGFTDEVLVYDYDSSIQEWNLLGGTITQEQANDNFGGHVSISENGNKIASGATLNSGINGTNSGHVRIFEYNETDGTWMQVGSDIDGEAAEDGSGTRVTLSDDGNRIAISAIYNDGNFTDNLSNTGHARVYEFDNVTEEWYQIGQDIDGSFQQDVFGQDLSISGQGDRVAGASRFSGYVIVYDYNLQSNAWHQVGQTLYGDPLSEYYGTYVDLNKDGNRLVVSTGIGLGDALYVRVYDLVDDEWIVILNTSESMSGKFGTGAQISRDGRVVLLSTLHTIRAYEIATLAPTPSPSKTPTSGPTGHPTTSPSSRPSATPTQIPTLTPTISPTRHHVIDEWSLSHTYTHLVKHVNDMISFTWTDDHHDLLLVNNYDGSTTCMGGQNIPNDTFVDPYHSVSYTFSAPGTYYFYCPYSDHCQNGMQKTVTVLPIDVTVDVADKGEYNDPYDQMIKKACPVGEYQDQAGETFCKESSHCPAGFHVDNFILSEKEGAPTNRQCVKCAVDRISTTANSRYCEKCTKGTPADSNRTRCLHDDGDEMEDWVLYVIIAASVLAFIIVGVLVYKFSSKRKSESKKRNAIYSLVY